MTRKMRVKISDAIRSHPSLPGYPSEKLLVRLIEAQRRKCHALAQSTGPHRYGRLRLATEQRDNLIRHLAWFSTRHPVRSHVPKGTTPCCLYF